MAKRGVKYVFPPLDVADLPNSWILWIANFHTALGSNGIEDDHQKLTCFLDNIGEAGFKILLTLIPELRSFHKYPQCRKSFNEVWIAFDNLIRSRNVPVETIKLHRISQKAAKESALKNCSYDAVLKMYEELSQQAEKCQYECSNCRTSYKDRVVRDHLLATVSNADFNLYFRGLERYPTVAEMLQKIRSIEQVTIRCYT